MWGKLLLTLLMAFAVGCASKPVLKFGRNAFTRLQEAVKQALHDALQEMVSELASGLEEKAVKPLAKRVDDSLQSLMASGDTKHTALIEWLERKLEWVGSKSKAMEEPWLKSFCLEVAESLEPCS